MAGRPTKLTPDVQAAIVALVEVGNYVETAVLASGVTSRTYYNWLERGEADEEPYAEFFRTIKEAEHKAEKDALATAKAGATGGVASPGPHWTSTMTFLERRFPTKWGKRDPDHGLKTKLLEQEVERSKAEIDTLKAKLKLLEAGHDPDAQHYTIVVPQLPENPKKADR